MPIIITPTSVTLDYQTTPSKPTTRVDGSALQIGDRWYSPNTGIEVFWNGSYWLGEELTAVWVTQQSISTVLIGSLPTVIGNNPIFLNHITISGAFTGTVDASNYHRYTSNIFQPTSISILDINSNNIPVIFGFIRTIKIDLNAAYLNFTGYFDLGVSRVGWPGNIFNPFVALSYRKIYV